MACPESILAVAWAAVRSDPVLGAQGTALAAGVVALVAFCLSALLTRAAIRIAPRIGYVDRPGGHKTHGRAMPYGGGAAIFLAAWVPATLALALAVLVPSEWVSRFLGERVRDYAGGLALRAAPALHILAGGAALFALGLIDDLRPLGARTKLAFILAVALLVTLLGRVRVADFLGPVPSVVLSALWVAAIVNAFNFLDNMDGLSAGVAVIGLGILAACGLLVGQVLVPLLAALFAGAIGGFLLFNFPPARIFMGDAGSLLVGYMLAVVSILTTYYESAAGAPPYALAMPVVVLAVPLYDLISVVWIRWREGRSPLRADQRHFSHRLVDRGLSRRAAVLTIYLATAATGLTATLLPGAGLRAALTVCAVVLLVLAMVAILEMPLRRGP